MLVAFAGSEVPETTPSPPLKQNIKEGLQLLHLSSWACYGRTARRSRVCRRPSRRSEGRSRHRALYAAFYSVPDKYKQIVIEAVETADAMTIAIAAGIALAFILLLASSGSIWRALTFTAFPRDRARTTACVLWLHGLGDRGAGFYGRDQLRQAGHSHVMFALPDADLRPVTAAEGGKKARGLTLRSCRLASRSPMI